MKIKIIGVYFGTLPPYFQLWLDTVGRNPAFTWLLYTDADLAAYTGPENLRVIPCSFAQIKERVQDKLGYAPDLTTPWGLCKFRVAFGKIFEDDLKDADYWGWTDFDVLYGDLTPVLRACEAGYDKILPLGHLSLVRNDARLTAGILAHPLTRPILSQESPETGSGCFDEIEFASEILPSLQARQQNDIPFAHFYCRYGHFRIHAAEALYKRMGLTEGARPAPVPGVFTWRDGHLHGWFALSERSVKKVECVYIHFFRRDMDPRVAAFEKNKAYLIVPNEIIAFDGHDLTWGEIAWLDRPRIHWRYFLKRLTVKKIAEKLSAQIRKSGPTVPCGSAPRPTVGASVPVARPDSPSHGRDRSPLRSDAGGK